MLGKVVIFCLTFVLAIASFAADDADISASLGYLPKVLESADKGAFVDLVKALDSQYGGKINISVYPIARSVENVVSGKADFQMPWIKNKLITEDKLPFRYLSEKMGDVYFVIYSHKDKPITAKDIEKAKKKKKFPYTIETYNGLADYYDFPTVPSTDVAGSLKKVNLKRVDAVIFAQEESDHALTEAKLKNIHRALYDRFDDVIIVQKGTNGDRVDQALSAAMKKLKADGSWQKMFDKVHSAFKDWQPKDMKW